jgi:hypothetical protein
MAASILDGCPQLAQTNKRAHDSNIHFDGACARKWKRRAGASLAAWLRREVMTYIAKFGLS